MREDAAAAARRIVEDVLARHGQGGPPPGDSTEPSDDVATADESAASEEAAPSATLPLDTGSEEVAEPVTEAPSEPADTEVLTSADAAASDAARIARRIVAEALGDAEHPPDVAPPPAARDDAPGQDAPTGDAPAPAPTGTDEIVRRIVADVQADADDAASGGVVAGPEPPDEAASDDAEPADPDMASVLGERSNPTTTLPARESLAVGAPAGARVGDAPAADESAPLAPLRRPLEGWAAPADPAPGAPPIGDAPPRTLRWLLASLLGAVALAVLFPLAVAALRALVTMD